MNYSDEVYTVSQNERVAQLVTITTGSISFEKVEDLDMEAEFMQSLISPKDEIIEKESSDEGSQLKQETG